MEILRTWFGGERLTRDLFTVNIPRTAQRRRLSGVLNNIVYWGDAPVQEYDQMAAAEGLGVVSRSHPKGGFRTDNYVFAEVLGEQWAKLTHGLPEALNDQTFDYLRRRGYEPVARTDSPKPGDIAAYRNAPATLAEVKYGHFGVIEPDGSVVSRYTNGYVFRHALGQVPLYGTGSLELAAANFFRKTGDVYRVDPEEVQPGVFYLPPNERRDQFGVVIFSLENFNINKRTAGMLSELGISLVEDRRRQNDRAYRCHQYALGTRLGQEWVLQGENFTADNPDLWGDTINYLSVFGFRSTEIPNDGDLVVYYDLNPHATSGMGTRHFGIWEGYTVVSKIAKGNIYRHGLGMIPSRYGDYARFLTRDLSGDFARLG